MRHLTSNQQPNQHRPCVRGWLLAVMGFVGTSAQAQTLVFSPDSLSLAPGERALVAVELQNIPSTAVHGYQLSLSYDPNIIRIVNPNQAYRNTVAPFAALGNDPQCESIRAQTPCLDPVWLLTQDSRNTAQGPEVVDNATGNVQIVYGTHGVQMQADGGGAVAMLEVIANSAGNATVTITDSIIADNGSPPGAIAHTTGLLSVQVSGPDASNSRPTFVPVNVGDVGYGQVTSIDLVAIDIDGDPLVYRGTSMPIFASLVDNGNGTARLRLAPTRMDFGTFGITVTVSDGASIASETIKFKVGPPNGN